MSKRTKAILQSLADKLPAEAVAAIREIGCVLSYRDSWNVKRALRLIIQNESLSADTRQDAQRVFLQIFPSQSPHREVSQATRKESLARYSRPSTWKPRGEDDLQKLLDRVDADGAQSETDVASSRKESLPPAGSCTSGRCQEPDPEDELLLLFLSLDIREAWEEKPGAFQFDIGACGGCQHYGQRLALLDKRWLCSNCWVRHRIGRVTQQNVDAAGGPDCCSQPDLWKAEPKPTAAETEQPTSDVTTVQKMDDAEPAPPGILTADLPQSAILVPEKPETAQLPIGSSPSPFACKARNPTSGSSACLQLWRSIEHISKASKSPKTESNHRRRKMPTKKLCGQEYLQDCSYRCFACQTNPQVRYWTWDASQFHPQ